MDDTELVVRSGRGLLEAETAKIVSWKIEYPNGGSSFDYVLVHIDSVTWKANHFISCSIDGRQIC